MSARCKHLLKGSKPGQDIDLSVTGALNPFQEKSTEFSCCDGRVVKALDLKSNGIFPRRFEPCSQRIVLLEPSKKSKVHISYHLILDGVSMQMATIYC